MSETEPASATRYDAAHITGNPAQTIFARQLHLFSPPLLDHLIQEGIEVSQGMFEALVHAPPFFTTQPNSTWQDEGTFF